MINHANNLKALLPIILLEIGLACACFPSTNPGSEVVRYTATLAVEPGNGTALVNRCAHYINLADYTKAIADCTRALQLQPNSVQALQNRATAFQRWGRLRESLRDWEQALVLMEQGESWRRTSPEQIEYARTQSRLIRQQLGGEDNSKQE